MKMNSFVSMSCFSSSISSWIIFIRGRTNADVFLGSEAYLLFVSYANHESTFLFPFSFTFCKRNAGVLCDICKME